MSTQMEALEQKIDQFYEDACKRAPTYEAVVHTIFCNSMRAEFGDDEHRDDQAVAAFKYARFAYDYQSLAELEQSQAEDRKDGICSHGLTHMTCPCGCFEF